MNTAVQTAHRERAVRVLNGWLMLPVVTVLLVGTLALVVYSIAAGAIELAQRQVVQLDDERRAAMVSNLMVVLCGESEVHPVVNAGTLYA